MILRVFARMGATKIFLKYPIIKFASFLPRSYEGQYYLIHLVKILNPHREGDVILIYIIIGAILATIGLSLLNEITELMVLVFELLKAHLAVRISKLNTEVLKEQNQENDIPKVIGFTIPNEEEEDDNDYEIL